jgi:hypothetical protein
MFPVPRQTVAHSWREHNSRTPYAASGSMAPALHSHREDLPWNPTTQPVFWSQ